MRSILLATASRPAPRGATSTVITPAPPTWAFNPQTRVLSLTHPNFPASQLEYLYQGGAYQAYTASLLVDGNAHRPGEWLGRVKEAAGRTASQVAESSQILAASATGWDGRPMLVFCMGDSRTNGPDRPGWPEELKVLLNSGDGAGHYEVSNGGQNGWSTTDWVNGTNLFMGDKAQKATYYRSILTLQVGVNNKNQDPNASVMTALAEVQQIIDKNVANGFDGVFLLNEAQSYTRDADPGWFDSFNAGLEAIKNTTSSVLGLIDMDTLASIQNMQDPTVSGDKLHLTLAANKNFVAPFVLGYINPYASTQGMPTSATSTGGGKVTPDPPTLVLSGRTFTATTGNGLAASTLRYKVQGGPEQTGSSYTVPNASSLAAGDLAFYTVATGNYNKSGSATNTQAVAAAPVGYVIDPGFNMAATQNIETGWQTSTDFGDNKQQVQVVGDGFARFKGTRPYDTLSTKVVIPGGNQKVIACVTAIADYFNILESSGSGLFFKTIRASELPANGWVEIPFTSAGQQPVVLQAKSENGSLFDLDYFDIVPA